MVAEGSSIGAGSSDSAGSSNQREQAHRMVLQTQVRRGAGSSDGSGCRSVGSSDG